MQNSLDNKLAEIENFLYGLRNAGSKFSLERIEKLCAHLGNPQCNFAKIHIAGTNGKGSTCAMLESILRHSGLRVGMFTSPHLLYLGERVQIDREAINKRALLKYVEKIKLACDEIFSIDDFENYPSFFEFMTALAFLYFSDKKVDVAVIETGLGGRLDSTNVIVPDCCAITSIALEHTEFLGDTIEKIATEKAGIIKKNVPVVAGFLPNDVMSVIEQFSKKNNAPLFKISERFDDLPTTSLEGDFQRANAGVAMLCAEVLKSKGGVFASISQESILQGLANVSWAARWQKIPLKNGATLILDASHNPEGAVVLEANLQKLKETGVSPIITVGVLGEARAQALVPVVCRYAKKLILLVPNQPRALNFEALEKFVAGNVEVVRSKVEDVFKNGICTFAQDGETVVSTGSIYLAGEVLASLKSTSQDGLSDLI